jgi:hypothetical protein
MADELTIEKLRTLASDAGLNLTEEELQRMLPGVTRAKRQAGELRALIGAEKEPAVTFAALKPLLK